MNDTTTASHDNAIDHEPAPHPGATDGIAAPNRDAPTRSAAGLLNSAMGGAHGLLDRIEDNAAPVLNQIGDAAASAEVALQDQVDHFSEMRSQWTQRTRDTVRGHPLLAVGAALALGLFIAGVARRGT